MYESILIPLDGSLYAETALRHVACHEADARRVTLVRVINTVEQLFGVAQPNPLDSMEKTEELLAKEAYDAQYLEANRYLKQLKGLASYEGLQLQVTVVEGNPRRTNPRGRRTGSCRSAGHHLPWSLSIRLTAEGRGFWPGGRRHPAGGRRARHGNQAVPHSFTLSRRREPSASCRTYQHQKNSKSSSLWPMRRPTAPWRA